MTDLAYSVRELTYGGRSAWAYKKLTRVMDVQNRLLAAVRADDTSLALKLNQIDDEQASLIIDGEFVDLAEVKYLAKKVKKLGEKKALKLLLQYGTINRIKQASISDLSMIEGIGETLAKRILMDL
jgi:excinuclease UvrABC nuclease subunit